MRSDDAIALLISANSAKAIAQRTLRRANEDIKRAEAILFSLDVLVPEKNFDIEGYRLRRTNRKGRRQIDQARLLDEWESLPKTVRDRFDTVFLGTVAELEEIMGRDKAAPFLREPVGTETVLVSEITDRKKEKPERVEFGA